MLRPADEDLFRESTMSFGEHLDELRVALFKAILSISVGVLVGLYFGNWVVFKMKAPLEAALEKFFVKQAITKFEKRVAERINAGEHLPEEWKDPQFIEAMVNGERLLFDEAYLDPSQLLSALKEKYPQQFKGLSLPDRDASVPPKKRDLIRTFFWHAVEDDFRVRVVGMSAQEAFMIYMKAALVFGLVVSSPFALYFLWTFVAAGLYPHEKKYVYIFLPFSLGLFLAGAALAFFFVFPPVLEFFFYFNEQMGIDPDPRISEWLSFVLLLPLAFGVSFQLPLVMLFLQRIGIFSVEMYLSKWRVSVLVMAITAMIITPTGDPYTLLMLLVPLVFLYFGGIGLCHWMPGGRNPFLGRSQAE